MPLTYNFIRNKVSREIHEMNMEIQIQLQLLSLENNLRDLQEVLEGAPKYSLNVSGQVQASKASEDVFDTIPEGFEITKKFVIGVKQETELIGVIEIDLEVKNFF